MGKVPTYDGSGADFLTTADVVANIEEAIRGSSEFGEQAQLEADKGLAQIIQPVADELGQAYELLQATIDARSRVSAEGVQLDNLGELVGVPRQPATYSTGTVTVEGDPATVIPAGSRVRVPNGPYFEIDDETTIPGGGSIDTSITALVIGSVEATASSITEIVDNVSGWDTVTNAAAVDTGDEIETDSAYRRRIRNSLSAGGTARPAAIRAALERLDPVSAAAVVENLELETDSRGIPGKSYRPVVWPTGLSTAQEEAIVLAIWLVTPAGIKVNGSEAYTVTDDQGYAQPIAFEYGTSVEIWIVLDVYENPEYPSDGDAQLAAALKIFDNDYSLGSDVLPDDIREYLRAEIPGIDHLVIKIKIGGTPGASDTLPIEMDVDEVAYFDSHITVTHP